MVQPTKLTVLLLLNSNTSFLDTITTMEPTVVDSIKSVTPNDGEIKISTNDERKTPASQESCHQQDSTNLKLKRCKHGRIIIKDPTRKKQSGDIRELNQLETTVKDSRAGEEIQHVDPEIVDTRQSLSTDYQNELNADFAGENADIHGLNQSVSDNDERVVIDEALTTASLKNVTPSEFDESSFDTKKDQTGIHSKASLKKRDGRSRSRSASSCRSRSFSPLRKRPNSPSHRKSPRRYQRGKSPRRRRSSRSPRRRDRSRSPRSDNRTSSYRSSSRRRRSRQRSPRRCQTSPSNHRRDRRSPRQRSPRRRRSRSHSRDRNARLDEHRNTSSTNSFKLDTSISKPIACEVHSFQKASISHGGSKIVPNQFDLSDSKPKDPISAQSGNDDSKTPQSAPTSPFSDNSISSDIYDPEGPIIPISPGDSPPLPSPMNNAASNNNNADITYRYDDDKNDDDMPSSAVQLNQQEKYLQKLNRQERVVEEVKVALKPHYGKRAISKEQYKDVLRRAVPKVSIEIYASSLFCKISN